MTCFHALVFDDCASSTSSCWAPERKTSLRRLIFWWLYVLPPGTRSWTPGFTSYWGKLSWGSFSCCWTAAGEQIFINFTAGSKVFSTARWRPAPRQSVRRPVTVMGYLCETLGSKPSAESVFSSPGSLAGRSCEEFRCTDIQRKLTHIKSSFSIVNTVSSHYILLKLFVAVVWLSVYCWIPCVGK